MKRHETAEVAPALSKWADFPKVWKNGVEIVRVYDIDPRDDSVCFFNTRNPKDHAWLPYDAFLAEYSPLTEEA